MMQANEQEKAQEESLDGMPRLIKSWRMAYGILLVWLVLLILLLFWFTEAWA